jgi:hypothetical protein
VWKGHGLAIFISTKTRFLQKRFGFAQNFSQDAIGFGLASKDFGAKMTCHAWKTFRDGYEH